MPSEEFICEPLKPQRGSFDPAAMSHGEPGLPASFTWRGQTYRIAGLIEKWKTSGPCHSAPHSGEMYLRRHFYRVLTDPPAVFTIYCDRQAHNRKRPAARWFIFSYAPA